MTIQDGINDDFAPAKAVERYFHAWFEGLHRYAFSILQDNDEAKDAVQAVFLKLLERKEQLDDQRSIKSYLYVSVYNYCLNIKRHRKVKERYEAQNAHPEPHPEDPLIRREISTKIMDSIERLPPRCRLVFVKSRLEKKKYTEIAQEMNISVKTVEVQMGKALKLLRRDLFGAMALVNIFWILFN